MANFYASWWNETLTVYNKYTNPTTNQVTWFRHVIHNAFWKDTGNKIAVNNVILGTNDIICRIRKDSAFLTRSEWVELSDEAKAEHFTLSKGDIIVKGESLDEINEYSAGYRSNELIKKYKELYGCLIISKFVVNVGGGRCNEHYYVEGE